MINKHKITWYCYGCKTALTNVLHEVFFGNSRQKSIEYNLQAPLCQKCHKAAHGQYFKDDTNPFRNQRQEKVKEDLCYFLGINYYKTCFEVNQKTSQYLKDHKEYCLKKIMRLEV